MEFFKNKLVWLLAAVVVIGGGVWLATKDNNGGGTTTKTSVNQEVKDKCKTEVGDETFCKFAGAFGAAEAFKVTANTTGPEGNSVLEMQSDSKDNVQMIVKQNDQEQANIVLYNGTTYSKDYTDGKWFKYGSSDTTKPQVTDLKKEFAKGDFKADNGQKIDYVAAGTEKCDNLTCYKYQVKDPTVPTQEGFIWFDTKDYLLRRLTIKDGQTNTDMMVTYTSVNISEPSPTKEVPAVGDTSNFLSQQNF